MTVISQLLPGSTIKCYRFHLVQAWWRQIQKVGLSSEYKDPESEIGRWWKSMFGIAYLSPDEVEDSLVEDYMSVAPGDEKSTMFADYLTNTYMTHESLFPPSLWAEVPSDSKRTTNGPESFHAHFNGQFYCSHPSIHLFLDFVLKLQTTSYIKLRSINEKVPLSRADKEKEQSLIDLHNQYSKWYNYQRKIQSDTWIQISGENRHLNSLDVTRIMDRSQFYGRF